MNDVGIGSAQTLFELQMAFVRDERMREAAHEALVREALRAQPPLRVRAAGALRALARHLDPPCRLAPDAEPISA